MQGLHFLQRSLQWLFQILRKDGDPIPLALPILAEFFVAQGTGGVS